jgi:hypothetical protein
MKLSILSPRAIRRFPNQVVGRGVWLSSLAMLAITLTSIRVANAGEDDLWITEVFPATGEVEVTNVGSDALTLERNFPFCHRFRYSTGISQGTVFEAGESKVMVLNGLDPNDSDLWLYRSSNFGSGAAMISGLKWGEASNVGRTGVAVGAGRWTGVSDGLVKPADGMSLQVTGADPFSPENWSIGEPDLGAFGVPLATDPRFVDVILFAKSNCGKKH